jgi:hypothetical protein
MMGLLARLVTGTVPAVKQCKVDSVSITEAFSQASARESLPAQMQAGSALWGNTHDLRKSPQPAEVIRREVANCLRNERFPGGMDVAL